MTWYGIQNFSVTDECIPTRQELMLAYRQAAPAGGRVGIDAVLDQIEKSRVIRGLPLYVGWRNLVRASLL